MILNLQERFCISSLELQTYGSVENLLLLLLLLWLTTGNGWHIFLRLSFKVMVSCVFLPDNHLFYLSDIFSSTFFKAARDLVGILASEG